MRTNRCTQAAERPLSDGNILGRHWVILAVTHVWFFGRFNCAVAEPWLSFRFDVQFFPRNFNLDRHSSQAWFGVIEYERKEHSLVEETFTMKKPLVASLTLLILAGCNANESKEGRISKLESQAQVTAEALQKLESRIRDLERSASDNK